MCGRASAARSMESVAAVVAESWSGVMDVLDRADAGKPAEYMGRAASSAGRLHGRVRPVGWPPRLVEWPDLARSARALPKPRSDRDRLLAHGREPPRPAERPRLRGGRDPAPHPGVGFEGRGPPRGLRPDGRARLPWRADPRGLRRLRDGLHQLRDPVRGARAGRHGVPGRPERPRRPQLACPAPVGQRGAAPALSRAPGTRREARHVRAHGARRGHRCRGAPDDGPP